MKILEAATLSQLRYGSASDLARGCCENVGHDKHLLGIGCELLKLDIRVAKEIE